MLHMSAAVVILANATGCMSPYMVNRGRDAIDIFTVTVGYGAGAKARLGPVQAGLFFATDMYGLRSGELLKGGDASHGANGLDVDSFLIPMRQDDPGFPIGKFGTDIYRDRSLPEDEARGFAAATSRIPFLSLPCRFEETVPVRPQSAAKYLTQIEVAGGLLGTLRLGFNPGELLDFVLGWTTLDIFKDDLARKETKSNKASEDIDAGASNPQR